MSEVLKQFKQIANQRNLELEEVIEIFKKAVKLSFMKKGRATTKDELYPIFMQRIEVNISEKRNDITVTFHRAVVEKVENKWIEVSINDPELPEKKRKLGEMIKKTEKLRRLPRSIADRIKKIFNNMLNYKEKEILFKEFEQEKVHDIVIGNFIKKARDNGKLIGYLFSIDKLVGLLPLDEAPPKERYKYNEAKKLYVKEIREEDGEKKIILSRLDERFIIELMKKEIPEIKEGHVIIKKIVREPGVRTKIAVYSENPKLDPVGACLGPGAKRIDGIRKALGEKIDVVQYSSKIQEYIRNSLKPANIQRIALNKRSKKAIVVVPDDQTEKGHALGKNQSNKNLTSELIGWDIEIISEKEFKEKLEKEKNEILNTQSVLSGLKTIPEKVIIDVANNFVTLESIAQLTPEELVETIDKIDEKMAKKIIQRAKKYAKE